MAKKRSKPETIQEETKILPKEPSIKDQAVKLLKDKGYDAWLKDGVVLCYKRDDNTYKEITKILKESGYNSSYGVTVEERKGYESESRRQEAEGAEE